MDKNDFIERIEANKKLIYKICLTYCPDPELRKDLEQEILLQLWTSADTFDGRAKWSTWMYRVALNTAILFLKRSTRHSRTHQPMKESVFVYSDQETHDRRSERLWQVLAELKGTEKALALLYLDGLRHREIAAIMGITETNVATRLNRLKKRIALQLKKQEHEKR